MNQNIISRGKRQELTYDLDRRFRHKFEYYGNILPIKKIAVQNKLNPRLVRARLNLLDWNIYEAAEIPKGIKGKIKNETKL